MCMQRKMLTFVQKQGNLSLDTEFSLSRATQRAGGDGVTKPLLLNLMIGCLPRPCPARRRRPKGHDEDAVDQGNDDASESLELYGRLSTSQLQTASITQLIKHFFLQVGHTPPL